MKKKTLTASEMGLKGGKKRFEDIGPDGMAEMAKKGNEAINKKYAGTDFFKERSRKAVAARLRNKRQREATPTQKVVSMLIGD